MMVTRIHRVHRELVAEVIPLHRQVSEGGIAGWKDAAR
jgi:hypothetical protein